MRTPAVRVKSLPLAVVAVAALASALGGCTSGRGGPVTGGPLSSGTSMYGPIPRGSICTPGGRRQTFGFELFTNYGNTTVILDRVVLLHPHNERLIGSYAVPGDLLIGAPRGWPPKYAGIPHTWKDRQPVHGFRLPPGKSFNMVLGVEAITARRAISEGMLVYYRDSSGTYLAKNYFANIIAPTARSC